MPTVMPMRTSRPSITKGVPSARDSVRKYARLVFAVDSSLQHDKFVAAYTRHRVADAQDASEPAGNKLEQCVAYGMPQIIIELEVVEVKTMEG